MKLLRTLLLGLTLATTPGLSHAVTSLEPAVPSNAGLVIVVRDMPHTMEMWKSSPLKALWDDPDMQSFFSSMLGDLDIDSWDEKAREATGYTVDELLAMVEGDVVFFIPDFGAALEAEPADDEAESSDGPDFHFVIAAAVGDHAKKIEKLFLRMEDEEDDKGESEDLVRDVKTYREAEIHINQELRDEEDPIEVEAWTIVDGLVVVASNSDEVRDMVDAVLDAGAVEPLIRSSGWAPVARRSEASDVVVYVDLTQLVPLFKQSMADDAAADPNMPFTPEALSNALDLDGFRSTFATITLDGSRTDVQFGVVGNTDRGLLKLAAYGPGAAPRPPLVPADATSFSSARLDFQKGWSAVEEMMNTLNPALLAMAAGQLNGFLQAKGVELDLRRDLLENLGDELFVVETDRDAVGVEQATSMPGQGSVIGIEISQRQGIELTIESLKGLVGQGSDLFSSREYLGTTIYSLKPEVTGGGAAGSSAGMAYAVTDGWLLVSLGAPQTLEEVLVANSRPGASAWDRDDVKSSLAELPSGAAAIGFQDLSETALAFLRGFATEFQASMDESGVAVEPAAVPDAEVLKRHLGPAVGGFYREADGLYYHLRLLPTSGSAAK